MRVEFEDFPPDDIVVTQAFINQHPTKCISLSVMFSDDPENMPEDFQCALSINFMTPVDEGEEDIDSIFTLHQAIFGSSVEDVLVKFICCYELFALFDVCDLADQIYVVKSDGEEIFDLSLSEIIYKAEQDPKYSKLMECRSKLKEKSPRIVK